MDLTGNLAGDYTSDPEKITAASSPTAVLGVGQGIESAFVSLNLIYPIRSPMDGAHLTFVSPLCRSPARCPISGDRFLGHCLAGGSDSDPFFLLHSLNLTRER